MELKTGNDPIVELHREMPPIYFQCPPPRHRVSA